MEPGSERCCARRCVTGCATNSCPCGQVNAWGVSAPSALPWWRMDRWSTFSVFDYVHVLQCLSASSIPVVQGSLQRAGRGRPSPKAQRLMSTPLQDAAADLALRRSTVSACNFAALRLPPLQDHAYFVRDTYTRATSTSTTPPPQSGPTAPPGADAGGSATQQQQGQGQQSRSSGWGRPHKGGAQGRGSSGGWRSELERLSMEGEGGAQRFKREVLHPALASCGEKLISYGTRPQSKGMAAPFVGEVGLSVPGC